MFRPSNLGSYSTFNRVILKIFQTVRLIETVRLHRIWPEKLDHTVRTKLENKYLHTYSVSSRYLLNDMKLKNS